MKKTIIRTVLHALFLVICLITISGIKAETKIVQEIEHDAGIYAIELIKIALGILIMIGGIGFFITTNTNRAHWPAYIRRFFFGTFVFCNVFNQAFFNVIKVPNNKTLVCILGKCMKKLSFDNEQGKNND